jgi:asparagine synthase (glutamine-hydrolysing)
MCGLYGIVGPSANMSERNQQIKQMSNILEHRGPDGIGTSSGNNFIFGHRRLAIIDLDYGLQPMISEDKSITLIFNGEIYNYLELRQDLVRKGIRFKTHSDTEVLLRCYEYYGKEMLSKLNGMFAFAIFDSKTNTFFAARDHFGIKPLYYTILKDRSLVFSSEIKALFCIPEVKKSPDMLGLHEYLTFQYCLDDKTMFTGIKKLLPAHSLSINLSDPKIKISKWWDQSFEIDQTKKTEYFKDNLNYLIHDSIKNQLRGDVPIGAHLSGGLDSSIVVSSAVMQFGPNFKSFTGKFSESIQYDETRYAKILAKDAGCKYNEITITSDDFSSMIKKLIYFMDEPAAGPGLLPQYVVSKFAREHVSVVLGGQGGDELFGGYARYFVAYLEQCLKGSIYETQEEGDHIVNMQSIIPNLPMLKNYVPMLSKFWNSGLFEPMEKRYFKLLDKGQHLRQIINEDITTKFSDEEIWCNFSNIFNASKSKSYLNKMTYFDQNTLLPALLQVEDRVSMAVSLESRVPLLDYRIAELAASMPPSIKYTGGRAKNILKEAMASNLPQSIIYREDKMGFPVPLREWLSGPLKGFVEDIFFSSKCTQRGVLDNKKITNLLKNETQFGREIWGALCLELWFQNFFDGE